MGGRGYVSRAFQLCAHAALFAQRIEQCERERASEPACLIEGINLCA